MTITQKLLIYLEQQEKLQQKSDNDQKSMRNDNRLSFTEYMETIGGKKIFIVEREEIKDVNCYYTKKIVNITSLSAMRRGEC